MWKGEFKLDIDFYSLACKDPVTFFLKLLLMPRINDASPDALNSEYWACLWGTCFLSVKYMLTILPSWNHKSKVHTRQKLTPNESSLEKPKH